jgi:hypothetical protein
MTRLIVATLLTFVLAGTAEAKKLPTVTVGSNFYAASFKSVKAGSKVKF